MINKEILSQEEFDELEKLVLHNRFGAIRFAQNNGIDVDGDIYKGVYIHIMNGTIKYA